MKRITIRLDRIAEWLVWLLIVWLLFELTFLPVKFGVHCAKIKNAYDNTMTKLHNEDLTKKLK